VGHLALRGVRIEVAGRALLDAFDLDILPGEFVAVVGANGVGKTTLLRAVGGIDAPAAGAVSLDGVELGALAPHRRAQLVAALSADPEAPNGMTVREVALSGRFARHPWWDWTRGDDDVEAVDAALGRVDLADKADRAFDTLSSGERQRAWIALALAQGARALLLDEPTSHLDARYALEVLELLHGIAREGTTVVAVLHDLNEASAFADRIAVLGEGRLLAYGAPAEVLDPAILQRAYGVDFRRIVIDGETRVFARSAKADGRLEGGRLNRDSGRI
jgi:ABC-type cobalamin/Fe3+-siderophores transport system ATPase subunit